MFEPRGEHLGQASFYNFAARGFDGIHDAPQGYGLFFGVPKGVAGPWVAIAGLAHRSGIHKEHAIGLELDYYLALAFAY
jgi:hypothetical protein